MFTTTQTTYLGGGLSLEAHCWPHIVTTLKAYEWFEWDPSNPPLLPWTGKLLSWQPLSMHNSNGPLEEHQKTTVPCFQSCFSCCYFSQLLWGQWRVANEQVRLMFLADYSKQQWQIKICAQHMWISAVQWMLTKWNRALLFNLGTCEFQKRLNLRRIRVIQFWLKFLTQIFFSHIGHPVRTLSTLCELKTVKAACRILQGTSHALFPMSEWLPSGHRPRCAGSRAPRRRATFVSRGVQLGN